MKQAFYICTLALAFAACKKHDSPTPINNNESAAERLTGSYVGVTHFRYKNTNSMGISRIALYEQIHLSSAG